MGKNGQTGTGVGASRLGKHLNADAETLSDEELAEGQRLADIRNDAVMDFELWVLQTRKKYRLHNDGDRVELKTGAITRA